MSPANPAHRDLARRLLDDELGARGDLSSVGNAAERVGQNFSLRLAPLVTGAGSQALLSRSLHLTRPEFEFLERLRVGPSSDHCFEGMDEALRGVEATMALDAFVVVFANLIGLLVTFIGEDLAIHAVREAWPDVQPR